MVFWVMLSGVVAVGRGDSELLRGVYRRRRDAMPLLASAH